ncbi:MAG TPA: hypothetical protein VF621_08760 [Pyrinomonadaceae bacterium]
MPKKKQGNRGTVQHDGLPRLMNDTEWDSYSQDFPGLTRAKAYVTSEGTYDGYNCIGWTVGDLTCEYDVGPVVEMVQFYRKRGFYEVPVGSEGADVDLMAISEDYFASHAIKRYTGPRVDNMPADLWESKLYPGIRITHGRDELEGNSYGVIVKSFRRAG